MYDVLMTNCRSGMSFYHMSLTSCSSEVSFYDVLFDMLTLRNIILRRAVFDKLGFGGVMSRRVLDVLSLRIVISRRVFDAQEI